MKKTIALALIALFVLSFALASCAPGPNPLKGSAVELTDDSPSPTKPAGFWQGLWHGMIAPITFVVSLFNKAVNVYEVRNSGNWYNFGFIIGVSIAFGGSAGGAAGARRRRMRGE